MSKKFKTVVVGCGRMGSRHAAAYLKNEKCDLVAIADIRKDQYDKFIKENKTDAAYYSDYIEMIKQEEPDIVSICTYPVDHFPMIRETLKFDVKAIHCEKPLGATWGEGQAIRDEIQGKDVQLTFNHQRRFLPAWQKALELLDSNEYGSLEKMEAYVPDNIVDWGTHAIDYIFMFNKEIKAKWVIGQIDAREHKAWFDIPFEFMSTAYIGFENNVRAAVYCGAEKLKDGGIILYCSNGIIEIEKTDGSSLRAVNFANGGWKTWSYAEEDGLLNGTQSSVNHMVGCVGTNKKPMNNYENAVRATEVIFAIYESSRSRCRIDLPLKTKDSAFLSMLKNGEIGERRWFYQHKSIKDL